MVQVTLDVTGFYFSQTVDVPEGASVEDVMLQAERDTRNDPEREFSFVPMFKGTKKFLQTITVNWKVEAESRQQPANPGEPRRKYPAGVYIFDDELGSPVRNNLALVWQYYIFDETGALLTADRKIVPFSETNTGENPIVFKDGYKVVWRLVAICTGPSFGSGSPKMTV